MPVTVNVGEILACDQTDEIRTRGCDPCVALIVIYVNGADTTKKCAHFSVNIAGPLNQVIIDGFLNPVLVADFPLPNIHAVGFAWGGNVVGMGGNFIFNRLADYFFGMNILVQSNQDDSLTTAGLGIGVLNGAVWPWTNDPPLNLQAQLG